MARFRYGDYTRASPEFRSNRDSYRPLLPWFQGRRRVVDLGCGEGLFLDLLAEVGVEGWGIDADESLLEGPRARGCRVVRGDLVDVLRRGDATFDGAFCAHVIEHMGFESVLDLVEAVGDRLEPDGILVLLFPNPENLDVQLRWFWRDPDHVRFYSADLIAAVLGHYGFQIVEKGTRRWDRAEQDGMAEAAIAPSRRPLAGLRWRLRELVRRKLGISEMEPEVRYLREIRRRGEDVLIVARKPGAGA